MADRLNFSLRRDGISESNAEAGGSVRAMRLMMVEAWEGRRIIVSTDLPPELAFILLSSMLFQNSNDELNDRDEFFGGGLGFNR